jgi:hypothetical protein
LSKITTLENELQLEESLLNKRQARNTKEVDKKYEIKSMEELFIDEEEKNSDIKEEKG